MDVQTAGGKKHFPLCRHHAAKLLKKLAQDAGEHPALMGIIKAREEREERRAVARGERAVLSKAARKRGIMDR